MKDPFSRLAPFVREYIYAHQWKELRAIQEAAIGAVLDGRGHILIAAGTASGKTEAAFFPIISLLWEKSRPGPPDADSAAVLYIGPLKALINDQFERLKDLLARGEIPVWRWHGEVPADHKMRFLERPSGILQISPESLEALLLRRPEKIRPLFKDLAFVLVDEVHAFMGSDRGGQLLCQLARIEELAGCRPRRIGLSATLGDYREAMDWLVRGSGIPRGEGPGTGNCLLIREENSRKRLRIALDYFITGDAGEAAYYGALYEHCRGNRAPTRKCIIFTNSRLEAEETIAALRNVAAERHEDDIFHVHHGSISGVLRKEAEEHLKEKEGVRVTAATASLELGIDIGRLDRVIQIGPPLSVSGFVQRLGRSGRRTGVSEIYFTALEDPPGAESPAAAIPWTLLRTIAVIQLYLEDKWIEPAAAKPLPLSLLCHQTLSILASLGEQRPAELARRVLSLPPFAGITQEDYRDLLRGLIENDYIEETGEKTLILGLAGEPILNHYSFYAIFPDENEFRVTHGGKELGTVNFLPPQGSALALAGRYWQVEGFDPRNREIYVQPADQGGNKVWRGGGVDLHPRIAARMRQVLAEDILYPYLSEQARTRLIEARLYARPRGLPAELLTRAGKDSFFLIPWLGSRGMRTLLIILENREIKNRLGIRRLYRENEYVSRIITGLSIPAFKAQLRALLADLDSREQAVRDLLPGPDKLPLLDKYDYLLPPRLLLKQYALNMLDMAELRRLFL
ncbi:MAG: DEAD/DEAH box helicase [Treponema sp.]|jgi:ATP-dependent Lhr-like helicase|nr:DEAD/DEAH box helicase [Treponema sp.]